MSYYSDEERGTVSRVVEEIGVRVWNGLLTLMRTRVQDSSFGASFPEVCPDGSVACGANMYHFEDALIAELPNLKGVIEKSDVRFSGETVFDDLYKAEQQPDTIDILDLLQFCWKSLGKPTALRFHQYFGHSDLIFDQDLGRKDFRNDVETILRRNGIAYTLTEQGRIERLVPSTFRSSFGQLEQTTSDTEFNRLISVSTRKFVDPKVEIRKEALESLWDAWERLKTLDGQGDKKAQAVLMLNRTSGSLSPKFRDALEMEAIELTKVGNTLRIRHSETTQEPLIRSEHVDYLFLRLYSLIRLVLQVRVNDQQQSQLAT